MDSMCTVKFLVVEDIDKTHKEFSQDKSRIGSVLSLTGAVYHYKVLE